MNASRNDAASDVRAAPPPRSALERHRPPRVDMSYELEIDGATRRIELPFVIGVMADLSGNAAEPREPVADRRFIDVDRDGFDAHMAAVRPRLALAVPNLLVGEGTLRIELAFARLAGFSPAAIAQQVEPLRNLLASRGELRGEEIAETDRRIAAQLNAILQAPEFRKLESAWRGLHHLATRTETDEMLKIRVLDIGRKELNKTLRKYRGSAWDRSPIFRKLYTEQLAQHGGEPFAVIVCDFQFDHGPADVETLGELSRIGAAAHAPIVAGAAATLMQMESWRELPNPRHLAKIFDTPEYAGWRALRGSEDARYLALCLPRFLARLPCRGAELAEGAPAFDEDAGEQDPDSLVWANSAYAFAANVARAFKTHGWCARICGVERGGAVEGLPVLAHAERGGDPRIAGPAEIAIDDAREAELARAGLIALVQRNGTDLAAFLGANSLHKPLEYDDPDATENARRAARLPYVFATCRVAHYLKSMMRDRLAATPDRESLKEWLDAWIADYVDPHPSIPYALAQPPRPFAAAEISVKELPGEPERFTAKFFLRPND